MTEATAARGHLALAMLLRAHDYRRQGLAYFPWADARAAEREFYELRAVELTQQLIGHGEIGDVKASGKR